MLCSSSFCWIFMCTNPKQIFNVCAQLISQRNEHFFGDTFDVLCFHMYKLQAYFENISVLEMISLMESSVLLGSNWSFFCKASRSGWATLAGSCRLACCPQNVLTAAQFGVHGAKIQQDLITTTSIVRLRRIGSA